MTDLPCDSEPHGEVMPMSQLMAMASEPNLGRVMRDAWGQPWPAVNGPLVLTDADGHPWSPGEGTRTVADARRDQADAAFRRALGEFCGALRIPVPIDWRRAQRAFAGVGLIGPR